MLIGCKTLEQFIILLAMMLGLQPRFRWFSGKTAREANRRRNKLLEQLEGKVGSEAGGSKLHTGSLSPGCNSCIEGYWACNFINRLCNRDCFFCKRSHSLLREEPEPETWGFFFPDPSAHLAYLKTFNIQGVSFSGGEPLLVKERLLRHLEAVRGEFGDSVYIWMYTNGDLVNREILEELNKAGLDEIRFNIAAREYDLSPVILARKQIKTVTVEIPCVPEDHEALKKLLPKMEKSGVDFLNIHQLSVEEQNCRELVSRRYSFTGHGPAISVFESEISALELLLHAIENGISLPINYCSSIYKQRYQVRGYRKQCASAFPPAGEELTAAGYLRRIELTSNRESLRELESMLIGKGLDRSLWRSGESPESMVLHSSLLRFVNLPSARFALSYFQPGVKPAEEGGLLEAETLVPDNRLVLQIPGISRPSMEILKNSYMGPKDDAETAVTQSEGNESGSPDRSNSTALAARVSEFETLPRGFPSIF